MKKLIFLFTLVIILVGIKAWAQESPIPKKLNWGIKPESASVSQDKIIIKADAGTNIFSSPDGVFISNNAPRLLFEADRSFVLNAKVHVNFQSKWDAGVLYIESAKERWAKLCFEKDYKGDNRIVSVVTKGLSDDCNSDIIVGNEVYLQIIGIDDVFNIYYSKNGSDWYLIRSFEIKSDNPFQLGFMAQSPVGQGCQVTFSEVNYKAEAPKDLWLGK